MGLHPCGPQRFGLSTSLPSAHLLVLELSDPGANMACFYVLSLAIDRLTDPDALLRVRLAVVSVVAVSEGLASRWTRFVGSCW